MSIFETVYRFFGWWIINIDLLLIGCIIMGAGLLFLQLKKSGRRFLAIGCFGIVFLGLMPLGVMMFEDLENRFPKMNEIPKDVKGMIFLGGSFDQYTSQVRKETAYNLAGGRFLKFIQLERENPDLQIVFSGNAFETETAKKEFKALGVDPSRIIFEGGSKDTKENAANTLEILKDKKGEKWMLVTSAYHMPRAVGLFRMGEITIIPYPVDYHAPGTYEWLPFIGLKVDLDAWHAALREWLGMIANYLAGRSDVIYPGP